MMGLKDENRINKIQNLDLANFYIAKEKQYKDKIESCHREMQKLGAFINRQQLEIQMLRKDNTIKKEAIVDLGKREAEEPIVEKKVEFIKA